MKKNSSYRNILLDTPSGEHAVQVGSHALLRKQRKDHRVGQHGLRVLVYYLTVDTQQNSPRLAADHRDTVR